MHRLGYALVAVCLLAAAPGVASAQPSPAGSATSTAAKTAAKATPATKKTAKTASAGTAKAAASTGTRATAPARKPAPTATATTTAAAPAGASSRPSESVPAPAVPRQAPQAVGSHSGSSGFMDVRLNMTLTDENVFVKPGETIPSVPGWRFGVPNSLGTLFFDNYDTRYTGYETLSHAVLYKRHSSGPWDVEGALVLRINDLAENSIDLSDDGSYIRVQRWLDPTRVSKSRISLTAFPTSSDRFRLGYSYRLSWGGSPEYQRSHSAVPGIKLEWENERAYAFVGAKSAVILDQATAEDRAVLGFLGGAGYDVTPMLRVEFNSGYFDRGDNELPDVINQEVRLAGASVQVTLHKGMPIRSSVDYALYRNDPELISQLFGRPKYPGGLSWLVSSEATVIGQTLKDPAVSGGTTVQYGSAGDINARVKYNRSRFRFDVQYRDLAFILHTTPSLPTYSDFPSVYTKTPNYFVDIGADHYFGHNLTLGLILGVDKPATLKTPSGAIPGDPVASSGYSTAVIRSPDNITILPQGSDALPEEAAKFTGRLDFSRYFAGLVDVYYVRDPNQTRLTKSGPMGDLRRVFGEFNQLGFNFTLQAHF